jgi:hypothetical protein
MHPCFVDKGDRDSRIDCRLLIVVESPDITLPPAVAKQSSTLDWESTINRQKVLVSARARNRNRTIRMAIPGIVPNTTFNPHHSQSKQRAL